jgi:hypothetical protein
MRRADYLFPIFFVVVGATILYQSLFKLVYFDSQRGAPGPGFLAFWLAAGLIGVSLGIIVTTLRRHREAPAEIAIARSEPVDPVLAELEREAELEAAWPTREGWQRIAFLLLPFVALLFLFERAGFIISTALYIGITGYGLGFRRLVLLLPTAIGAAFAIYYLFSHWLGVNLPAGLISL